jgi:hypothetical protein
MEGSKMSVHEIDDRIMNDLNVVMQATVEAVTDEASDNYRTEFMYAPFKRFVANTAKLYMDFLTEMTYREGTLESRNGGKVSAASPMTEEETLMLEKARNIYVFFGGEDE